MSETPRPKIDYWEKYNDEEEEKEKEQKEEDYSYADCGKGYIPKW